MKPSSMLLTLFVLVFITGCASTGFFMARPKAIVYGDSLPPRAADSSIDVYVTSKPEKAYIEIAQISCEDTDDDWCIKQLKIKAREIGAEGLIIIGPAGYYGIGTSLGSVLVSSSDGYGMIAIAIKYKDK